MDRVHRVPRCFYVTQQADFGNLHLCGSLTRFIPPPVAVAFGTLVPEATMESPHDDRVARPTSPSTSPSAYARCGHDDGRTIRLMSNRTLNLDDKLYRYLLDHSVREHPAQIALREATRNQPHAAMQISPDQAQLMALLVRLIGARNSIEIGVFTGYSALSVALALPDDGHLLACDINDDYTRVGKPHWQAAGVAHKIDLRLAPALETLDARLAEGAAATYDFAFIDADKGSYDAYYERCLQLLRPGGLITIDNVLWSGSVARPAEDADTRAIQALNDKLRRDERIDLAMLAIGDGLTLARKR